MTVKLLSPTDMWTPAKKGCGVDEGEGIEDPVALALAIAPTGAIPGSMTAVVVAEPGDRSAGLLEQGPGRLPGLLGGPVRSSRRPSRIAPKTSGWA